MKFHFERLTTKLAFLEVFVDEIVFIDLDMGIYGFLEKTLKKVRKSLFLSILSQQFPWVWAFKIGQNLDFHIFHQKLIYTHFLVLKTILAPKVTLRHQK